MLRRGTRLRRLLCHLSGGHAWRWPSGTPGALVSDCLHQCGAVRRLQLNDLRAVRVLYARADPAKVKLRVLTRVERRRA